MPPQKNEIPLIMQRHHRPPHQLRRRREQRLKQMRREEAQRRAEIVQDELGDVTGWIAVAGDLLAVDPVREREVEHGSVGEVYDVQAMRTLLVFY